MRPEVVRFLRCPICHDPLELLPGQRGPLRCPRGHSFDQARQGYAQLTTTALAHTGDTVAMVAARGAFLAAGHYAMITSALRDAAAAHWPGGLVLDVGAGTGHHLAGVLDALPAGQAETSAYGLATDVSKPAIRIAARAHARADAVICDAWQPLPIADSSVGVLLDVFAPRPGAEFARVVRPDGVLLVVVPTATHLTELVEPLGLLRVDPAKDDRVSGALDAAFSRESRAVHEHVMVLDHTDVATLVQMGPSAHHIDVGELAGRIAALPDPVAVTASVTLSVYRPAR
jgi:23S rRNA (guanine745-N1)-methyltransferase